MSAKLLDKILNFQILALVFLLPIFFLPFTIDFYEFNKQALLIVLTSTILITWLIRSIAIQKVSLKINVFDVPVLLLLAAYLASTIWRETNKYESLLLVGGLGTMLILSVFYFVVKNTLKEGQIVKLLNCLIASAAALGLLAVLQFVGVTSALFPSPTFDWLKAKTWTPAGGLLPLASLLVVLMPLLISRLYPKAGQPKKPTSLAFVWGSFLLVLVGLSLSVFQLATVVKPALLPQQTGWQIAIEALKISPLMGVGPNNFLNAFTQLKPLAFNQTNIWYFRFPASSNFYFHLLTTVGFLGLAAFALIVWKALRTGVKDIKRFGYEDTRSALYLTLIAALALFVFLPANFILLFTFYLILALLAVAYEGKTIEESSRLLPWTFSLPIVVILGAGLFFFGRGYLAEHYFRVSLEALAKGDGATAYTQQIQAISYDPYRSLFRITYAQTNFALANALAQKKDLNDQDRQDISTLIQQSIREAKAAVSLDPQNVVAWENLGTTYRSLINFAQGADSWSLASYNQAIALDPYNPNLRLSLGGIYYSLNQWDAAIKAFEDTITLKPDFANGYYNLAAAYNSKGDAARAVAALEQTLKLIPRNSEDWNRASKEMESLQKALAEKANKEANKQPQAQPVGQATGSETLNPPQPLPEGITPPIALPTESGPEITPTIAPEPTTEAQPTTAPGF